MFATDFDRQCLEHISIRRKMKTQSKIDDHVSYVKQMIGIDAFDGIQPITVILFLMDILKVHKNAEIHEYVTVLILTSFLRVSAESLY